MTRKRRAGKTGCALLLTMVMIVGMLPLQSWGSAVQAEEQTTLDSANVSETEMQSASETETQSASETETQSASETEAQSASEKEVQSASETEADTETEAETEADTGSISGVIWLDENQDGIYDSGEQPVAGYEVSLYIAENPDTPIETAATDSEGGYLFEHLLPGEYTVGIPFSHSVEGREYLVPLAGMSGDNRFAFDEEAEAAYTDLITIGTGTKADGYSAGVRLPAKLQSTAVEIRPEPTGSLPYTVNSTILGFAGHEWWVIGDSGTGVRSQSSGQITLWSKNYATIANGGFGTSQFHPTNTAANANRYATSTLLTTMNGLNSSISTESRENAMIAARAILDDVGETTHGYAQPTNQKLWPLSYTEWITLNNQTVRSYGAHYWLRTPDTSRTSHAYFGTSGGASAGIDSVHYSTVAVRPAFYLNLPSVLFTSAASGASMKSATAGSPSLSQADQITSGTAIKMTAADNTNLGLSTTTTTITVPPGGTASFNYSGAAGGTGKSVSVMICDRTSGESLYYGRPVALSSGTGNAGTASFTVPSALPVGDYTLRVFNEEVNGANWTDYASTPVDITLRVRTVTVDLAASTTARVYYDGATGTVNLTADIHNLTQISGSTIQDALWLRVPVSNTTQYDTQAAFAAAYAGANASDKGVIPTGSTTATTLTGLPVDITHANATYWVMATVQDSATSTSFYGFHSITVDNIYTVTPVEVRGEISGTSPAEYLYSYERVSGTYGIPYDFGTATVLPSPRHGYDTVTIAAKSQYAPFWTAAMKHTATAVPLTLTLNSSFLTNTQCDSGDSTKYTIRYTRIPASWRTIDVFFVDAGGNPISIGGVNSDSFHAPIDSAGHVSAFLSGGGTYLPPSDTDYTAFGYGVGASYVPGNVVGSEASPVNFTLFDPVIPSGTNDVYIVYRSNTTELAISKTAVGSYANLTREFDMTLTLLDSSGNPVTDTYPAVGSAISGVSAPATASVTFTNGTAVFGLAHGQTLTLTDLPIGYTYTVQETDAQVVNGTYTATYGGTGTVSGTGDRISETLGSTASQAAITNTRPNVVPAGLSSGTSMWVILLMLLPMALLAGGFLFHRRRVH